MGKKILGMLIVVVIAILVTVKIVNDQPKVQHEYTPIPTSEIEEIKRCVRSVTGSESLNVEELLKDQILLSDVYRFCLKTVEDTEAVLKELAK